MPQETYCITLTRPDEMTPTELRDYIEIAVRQWGKGGDPGDPEWHVGEAPIKVERVTPPRGQLEAAQESRYKLVAVHVSGNYAVAIQYVNRYDLANYVIDITDAIRHYSTLLLRVPHDFVLPPV